MILTASALQSLTRRRVWTRAMRYAALHLDGTGGTPGTEIACGSNTILDNLHATGWTAVLELNQDALVSSRVLIAKGDGVVTGWFVRTTGTAGELQLAQNRATTNAAYTTNSAPLAKFGRRIIVVITYETTVGFNVYTSLDGTQPFIAATFSSASVGSGTLSDDSSLVLKLGARGVAGTAEGSFNGRFGGPVALFNRVLGKREWEQVAWEPWSRMPRGLIGRWFPGMHGALHVPDFSGYGNHGVVSGGVKWAPGFYVTDTPRRRWAAVVGSTTYSHNLAGSLTPAGALIREIRRVLAGSTAPSAALIRRVDRQLAGSAAPAAALVRLVDRQLGGSLTPAGALTRRVDRVLAGAAAHSGALERRVSRLLGGSVAPDGTLVHGKTVLKSFAGSLAPAGALVRQVGRVVGGTVTPSSSLGRLVDRLLGGQLAPAGGLVREVRRLLGGLLDLVGSLVHGIASTASYKHPARAVLDHSGAAAQLRHPGASVELDHAGATARIEWPTG